MFVYTAAVYAHLMWCGNWKECRQILGNSRPYSYTIHKQQGKLGKKMGVQEKMETSSRLPKQRAFRLRCVNNNRIRCGNISISEHSTRHCTYRRTAAADGRYPLYLGSLLLYLSEAAIFSPAACTPRWRIHKTTTTTTTRPALFAAIRSPVTTSRAAYGI